MYSKYVDELLYIDGNDLYGIVKWFSKVGDYTQEERETDRILNYLRDNFYAPSSKNDFDILYINTYFKDLYVERNDYVSLSEMAIGDVMDDLMNRDYIPTFTISVFKKLEFNLRKTKDVTGSIYNENQIESRNHIARLKDIDTILEFALWIYAYCSLKEESRLNRYVLDTISKKINWHVEDYAYRKNKTDKYINSSDYTKGVESSLYLALDSIYEETKISKECFNKLTIALRQYVIDQKVKRR